MKQAWHLVARYGMPPCDGETVFVGINTAGFACCFNEVTHDGVCSMQGPEISTVQMSALNWWRVLDLPGADGVLAGGDRKPSAQPQVLDPQAKTVVTGNVEPCPYAGYCNEEGLCANGCEIRQRINDACGMESTPPAYEVVYFRRRPDESEDWLRVPAGTAEQQVRTELITRIVPARTVGVKEAPDA